MYDIDLAELKRRGITVIFSDLDSTLVSAKEPAAAPELAQWFDRLRNEGFRLVIISNNSEHRVSEFAKPLSIPFFARAKKPGKGTFRRALQSIGAAPRQTAMIGDQLLTDVLGGNRAGLFTVLVDPISLLDESFFTKINRKMEHMVKRWTKQ